MDVIIVSIYFYMNASTTGRTSSIMHFTKCAIIGIGVGIGNAAAVALVLNPEGMLVNVVYTITVDVTVLSDTVPTVKNLVLGAITVDGLVMVRVDFTTAVTNLAEVMVRVEHTVLIVVTLLCLVAVVVFVVVDEITRVVVSTRVLDFVVVVEMLIFVVIVRTEPTNAVVVNLSVDVTVLVEPITSVVVKLILDVTVRVFVVVDWQTLVTSFVVSKVSVTVTVHFCSVSLNNKTNGNRKSTDLISPFTTSC